MGITRDSPLLTTAAQVVDLTGVQDLLNLEADAEFSVADTLLSAHREVYDRMKRRFESTVLANLSNQVELHRAVAYVFLEMLAAGRYVGDDSARDYWGAKASEEINGFRAEFTDATDEPRRVDEGIPAVANFDGVSAFPAGDRRAVHRRQEGYWGDLPTRN